MKGITRMKIDRAVVETRYPCTLLQGSLFTRFAWECFQKDCQNSVFGELPVSSTPGSTGFEKGWGNMSLLALSWATKVELCCYVVSFVQVCAYQVSGLRIVAMFWQIRAAFPAKFAWPAWLGWCYFCCYIHLCCQQQLVWLVVCCPPTDVQANFGCGDYRCPPCLWGRASAKVRLSTLTSTFHGLDDSEFFFSNNKKKK